MIMESKIVLEGKLDSSRENLRREIKVRKLKLILLRELLKRLQK